MRRRGTDAEATCREVARVLQAYLDGEVDRTTAARVAAHLDACQRCGMSAQTYRQIKDALGSLRDPVDPAAVDRLVSFAEELTG